MYFSSDFLTVHNCSFLVCSNLAFEGAREAITIVISLPETILLILPLPDLISSTTKSSPYLTSPPCSEMIRVSASLSPALTFCSSLTRILEPPGRL